MCCAVKMEVGSSSAPLMTVIIMDLKIAVPDRWWIIVWSITLCHVHMCVGEQQKPGERKKVLEHYVVLGREQDVLRWSPITDLGRPFERRATAASALLPATHFCPFLRRLFFRRPCDNAFHLQIELHWHQVPGLETGSGVHWQRESDPRALVCDSRGLFALSALLTETDKDLGLASCKCLCSHV